jgi:hypothetical protein
MKYSAMCAFALVGGVLLLGCSAEDSDPPPVAPGASINPAPGTGTSGAPPVSEPGVGTSAGGMMATAPTDGMMPTASEGQAGAALDPGMTDPTPDNGMAAGGAGGMNAAGGVSAAGGAAPTEMVTLDDLVGGLDGHLFTVACGDTPNTDDCNGEGWRSNGGPINQCSGGRLDARIDFPIGGEAGARYGVAMHFYGIMEPRNYGNVVTREALGRPSLTPGGTPTPFATMQAGAGNYLSTGDNNYNTYELHVLDESGQEVHVYFLNADTQTGHYTFGIDYEQTVEVVGGGVLRLQIADANCRQIKNCGPGGVPCAGKTQTIDTSGADPQPPAGLLQQPGLGKDPEHSGQWFLMDALSFEAR